MSCHCGCPPCLMKKTPMDRPREANSRLLADDKRSHEAILNYFQSFPNANFVIPNVHAGVKQLIDFAKRLDEELKVTKLAYKMSRCCDADPCTTTDCEWLYRHYMDMASIQVRGTKCSPKKT